MKISISEYLCRESGRYFAKAECITAGQSGDTIYLNRVIENRKGILLDLNRYFETSNILEADVNFSI